jgi:hypothetical protein
VDVVPILLADDAKKIAAYVCGYVLKKLTKEKALPGLKPEFTLMSKKPGIGALFVRMLARSLIKKGIGPTGAEDVAYTADLQMIRIDGKLYPLDRHMRDCIYDEIGGDKRDEHAKALQQHHKFVDELHQADDLEAVESQSSARARKAFKAYLKNRKL